MGNHDDLAGTMLITVDSLRADAFGPNHDEYAPTLSSLAQDGVCFENSFARGNWTPFSFPAIFGSRPVFADSDDVGLPETTTLAEMLEEAGVRTAGFNAANGFLTEYWGYDRGFETFETFMDEPRDRLTQRYLAAHPTVQGWLQLVASPFKALVNLGDEETPLVDTSHMRGVESNAIEFLQSVEDEPFFLWLHYMDAHTPYVPAPKHIKAVDGGDVGLLRMLRAHARAGLGSGVGEETLADLRSLYHAAVHQVDASVRRVLAALEAQGLDDQTAVIVAGDHGEEFQEHGHLAHYPKLYEELARVPLVVKLPGTRPQRVSRVVGLDALAPTICDAMDVPVADDFEGSGLLATIRDGKLPDGEVVTSIAVRGERVTQQPIPRRLDDGELLVSARTAEWTYVYNATTEDRELYDRLADPKETENVWASNAESPIACRLHRSATELVEQIRNRTAVQHDEEAMPAVVGTRLEALGYR